MRHTERREILRLLASSPWAMRPEAIAELTASVLRAEPTEPKEAAAVRRGAARSGSIAVIPLMGTIVPRSTLMTEFFGGAPLDRFSERVGQALADDSVSAIVLDVDSPGGLVDLVPETAEMIFAARGVKPIVAVANTQVASAAYYMASAASELVVTPSGEVGSIGVWTAHVDASKALEMIGWDITLISAGKYKTEGHPFGPLGDEAKAFLQSEVDRFYDVFVGAVARHRDVKPAIVRGATFGEGRMVNARAALAAGMVDRVATLGETIARLMGKAPAQATPRRARHRHELSFL